MIDVCVREALETWDEVTLHIKTYPGILCGGGGGVVAELSAEEPMHIRLETVC